MGNFVDKEARELGFSDNSDRQAAQEAGFSDPQLWHAVANKVAEEKRAAKAEADRAAEEKAARLREQAEAERSKKEREATEARLKKEKEDEAARLLREKEAAEKEAACKEDLQCWGDRHSIDATVACRPWVERLAKNDFQWIDGMFEPKFSRLRWKNKKAATITYVGDRIKYQNGFGAWVIHTYQCDYDPKSKVVTDVRASAGRLPP